MQLFKKYKMEKNKKIIIAGVGAILAYLYLRRNEGKILNLSDVFIFPIEFLV